MKEKMPDYYDFLGVSKNATKKEIKLAYKRKAKSCHPDKINRFDANELFNYLHKAYCTLMDDESRRLYNAELMLDIWRDLKK